MKRSILMFLGAAALAALWGCGSGSGDGSTATISGSVSPTTGRVAARTAAATGTGFTVEAVDDTGTTQDSAGNVTDTFTLQVPAGRDYVVVVGDDNGPIAAMTYAAGTGERADFSVGPDGSVVDVGHITVDVSGRSAQTDMSGDDLVEPDHMMGDDHDNDGIPDDFDSDDDNDGIRDAADHSGGTDMSMDHDNDGTPDDMDADDDNDGHDDMVDDHPMDSDDDGMDDDRAMGGMGDAAAGETVFLATCAGCHGTDGNGGTVDESIAGESARDIAEALMGGEDDMPAFPDLVNSAADIAAYLSGDMGTGGSQGGSGSTGGGSTGGTTGGGSSGGSTGGTMTGGGSTGGTGGGTGGGMTGGGTTTPDATNGGALYAAQCAGCHGSNNQGGFGPRLTPPVSRSVMMNGKGSMPAFTLTEAQLADIDAWLP